MGKYTEKVKLNRLLSMTVILLLIIQILIVGIFSSYGTWMVHRQEENSVDYILKTYGTNLNKALDKIENDLDDILSNTLTLEMLKNHSDLQRWHASYSLTVMLNEKRLTTEDVDGYVIYDSVYDVFLVDRNSNISYSDLSDIKAYFQKLNTQEDISADWTSAEISNKGYLLKCYNYGGVSIAALVSQEKIRQILSYGQDGDNAIEFFVTGSDKKIICSSNPDRSFGQDIQENKTSVFREKAVMGGAYYIIGTLQYAGISAQTTYFFIILVLMIISVLFLLIFRYLIDREVIRPVKILSGTSEEIQKGNLSIRPKFKCQNKEMLELKAAYIMMLDTIMELKVKQYEKVIQAKDSELKYMHMQLKPHFFLNALSTINSMAYKNRNEDIHAFIQIFSENIRYMFRAGLYTISLKEEVSNVKKYLEMQRMLYKDSFYAYFEVPEELEIYPIPQMMLHTFIENIFKHVIDINSFTTILLSCSIEEYCGEDMLKIQIQNTGKHYREEILRRINDNDIEESGNSTGEGIGLMHIKEILSIMYGNNHLLRLDNEGTDGTKVTVWIPEKEEKKHEFTNCR